MNTCKTCKHFAPRTDVPIGHGECALITRIEHDGNEFLHPSPPERNMIAIDYGGGYDQTYVGENFGCIHHETK